jgi:hypothetical protein
MPLGNLQKKVLEIAILPENLKKKSGRKSLARRQEFTINCHDDSADTGMKKRQASVRSRYRIIPPSWG